MNNVVALNGKLVEKRQNVNEAARTPRVMGGNIARDILKRASDFPNFASSVFEYVSNGYESYQMGDVKRVVRISYQKGKRGRLCISDMGCGMSYETLGRFWTMHAETVRRPDGLNLRGYNGTGKIAAFKYFNVMTVETVHNGLRNMTRLERRHVEEMARVNGPVQIDEMVVNEKTSEPDGTTITLSQSIQPLEAAQIAELRSKISLEMLMWMKGAIVEIEGEPVEAQTVQYDEVRERVSDCGNFKILMHFMDRGYTDELRSNFIHAGPVFIARENFGKEGHRLGHKLHCVISASDDWYREHFEGRREQFVSESRDLKLKLSHPEALKIKAFAEMHVVEYLKELDACEKEREQKNLDEHKRKLMDKLSKQFSGMMSRLDVKPVPGDKPVPEKAKERQLGSKSENPRERKPRITFELKEFQNDLSDYRINAENGIIEVNLLSPQLALIVEDKGDATWDQAIIEIVRTAFIEMETTRRMQEKMQERMLGFDEFNREQVATARELRIAINRMMVQLYRDYQSRRIVAFA